MIPGDLTIQTPPDEPVIRFQRFVAAPPALVFRAWTEPELLRRWWGPAEYQLIVCEVDLRVGGGYRFVHRGPGGVEYGSRGRYLEVEPGRRLVNTFTRDPAPDRESVDAVDFLAVGGGTLVSGVSRHESIAARDEHVNAGMEGGVRGAYRKLDDLMKQEQSGRGRGPSTLVHAGAGATYTGTISADGTVITGSWVPDPGQPVHPGSAYDAVMRRV